MDSRDTGAASIQHDTPYTLQERADLAKKRNLKNHKIAAAARAMKPVQVKESKPAKAAKAKVPKK